MNHNTNSWWFKIPTAYTVHTILSLHENLSKLDNIAILGLPAIEIAGREYTTD